MGQRASDCPRGTAADLWPGRAGPKGEAQGLGGSGLGLALARDQAEACGGCLELLVPASLLEPGLPEAGNAFRLQLPLGGSFS